jgi:uncharacterized membrane protein SpoIIM required for sporulation
MPVHLAGHWVISHYVIGWLAVITHPDYASLVDPLFRKRERGLFLSFYFILFLALFLPKAKRGWSSEATTG